MKCKYCKTTLVSNSSVCPSCGKDNLKDDLKGLKIATAHQDDAEKKQILAGLEAMTDDPALAFLKEE